MAIDLTLIPYHGEPFRDLDEVYRGQAKDGTSHFHAYATAYVVREGQRYTVALTGGDRPANAIFKARRQPAMIRPSILHSRVPDGQTILASR